MCRRALELLPRSLKPNAHSTCTSRRTYPSSWSMNTNCAFWELLQDSFECDLFRGYFRHKLAFVLFFGCGHTVHERRIFSPPADQLLPRRGEASPAISGSALLGRGTALPQSRTMPPGPGKIDPAADSGKLKWFSVLGGRANGSHPYTLPCLGVTPCWPMALIRPSATCRGIYLHTTCRKRERERPLPFSQIHRRIGALLRPMMSINRVRVTCFSPVGILRRPGQWIRHRKNSRTIRLRSASRSSSRCAIAPPSTCLTYVLTFPCDKSGGYYPSSGQFSNTNSSKAARF